MLHTVATVAATAAVADVAVVVIVVVTAIIAIVDTGLLLLLLLLQLLLLFLLLLTATSIYLARRVFVIIFIHIDSWTIIARFDLQSVNIQSVQDEYMMIVLGQRNHVSLGGYFKAAAT